MKNKAYFVVLSTCPNAETAQGLARELVGSSLAACVNIVAGVQSIYRWNGSLQSDEESLMVIKTTDDRLPALRERLVAMHPYEVPEVVALRIAAGHDAYLHWIESATATSVAQPGSSESSKE